MSDARDDIRNLFQSQGLTGGYREFGERPVAPRPAPPAEPAEAERKPPRLDLVRSAPETPPQEAHPLRSLFDRLARDGTHRTPPASAEGTDVHDLMHMPLADLFAHLASQDARR